MKEAGCVEKTIGYEVAIETAYKKLEQIKYELEKNKIKIIKIEYKENIKLLIEISEEKIGLLEKLNVKAEFLMKKYVVI